MRFCSSLAAIGCLTGALWSAPAAAIGEIVKGTFGDWSIRCEQQTGGLPEQCALVQNVTAEDRPNLTMAVLVLNAAGGSELVLRVVLPLGVLIPSGLGLRIDGTDIGKTGFIRCLPAGCIAEVTMGDSLLERFKTGQTALFIVFQAPDHGVGIPINLANFTEGLAALP